MALKSLSNAPLNLPAAVIRWEIRDGKQRIPFLVMVWPPTVPREQRAKQHRVSGDNAGTSALGNNGECIPHPSSPPDS